MTAARDGNTRGLTRPPPTSRLELEVPARTRSVGEARHAVTAFLVGNGVPPMVVDDVELMASELVTNAVLHPVPSGHPVRVRVSIGEDVRLEVAHHGATTDLPAVGDWRTAPPTALSGRGLGIVRRLADDVGVHQDGPWAVVDCGRKLNDHGGNT